MATPRVSLALQRLRQNDVFGESAWGLVLEFSKIASTVVAFTLLGRSLGAAGYGGYASLYAIVGPLVSLAASGVVLALLEHVVRIGEDLGETARSCLTLSLVLGFGLTAVGTGLAMLIVEGLDTVAIVSILLIEFVAAPLIHVAASVLHAGTGWTPAAKLQIVPLAGRVVLLVFLFTTDRLTVAALGVTTLVFTCILAMACLGPIGRHYGFKFRPGRVRWAHLKTNGLYSVAISASALNTDGDKLVLAANNLVVETGLYSAAYRIINFGLVPIGTLANVSHKYFLEEGSENPAGAQLRLAWKYGRIAGGYGVIAGIGLFVAAPLLPVLMGTEFEGSVEMARWLSPIISMRALGLFGLNGLMGLGRTAFRTVLIVVNAVVAIVGYIILVPRLGWEGAAIGTLASETVAVVTTWWALFHYQRVADRG